MSAASPAVSDAASTIDEQERADRAKLERDDAEVESACPRVSAAATQRAEPGERHLAERELAGPAGQHRERQRADREAAMVA